MVAIGLASASPKGKAVMMGIFSLIAVLLLGVVAAENHTEPVTSVDFNWDPKNPPLWTIRPEDREEFLATGNITRLIKRNDVTPCEDHQHPALLYYQYWEKDCPAPTKFHPDDYKYPGTCIHWDRPWWPEDKACGGFCQVRTYFEWAQESPYPMSECHFPVACGLSQSDSASVGWSATLSGKLGKMWKLGASGSWSWATTTATGRSFKVTLLKGECGYFTFVPVKKVMCGTYSFSEAYPNQIYDYWLCHSERGPTNLPNICDSEPWKIKNTGDAKDPDGLIPDGTVLFVYTDCRTRLPLPKEFQDPVYGTPGVSLHPNTIDSIQQGWVWNTCYFWDMKVKGERALFIRGSGFKDEKIGDNGEYLRKVVEACSSQAGGAFKNHKFTWYDNGKPEDSAMKRGAAWLFEGDVPETIRPGCVGEALMDMGASTQDQCVGNNMEALSFD
ncbi:hypothetical protein CORC01_04239 [Colletotrichum orchidophilum]|uniref:Uncharacterized protein n=1 Tax=Colletotrichum orchidophilum TaxID=1209926 RepID=A0A1G4BGH9_9PEZI|nr:uncharacterized protein CORC01_04239 [Colletotrichum orchidophilum]OHF00489.1 hypothetical protein CORC01_04239 [Colletotrichum orchidophilum]